MPNPRKTEKKPTNAQETGFFGVMDENQPLRGR